MIINKFKNKKSDGKVLLMEVYLNYSIKLIRFFTCMFYINYCSVFTFTFLNSFLPLGEGVLWKVMLSNSLYFCDMGCKLIFSSIMSVSSSICWIKEDALFYGTVKTLTSIGIAACSWAFYQNFPAHKSCLTSLLASAGYCVEQFFGCWLGDCN